MITGDLLNNKYQIISRLSIRGFRQKWLASDITTDNKVMVETLHDDLINDEMAIANIRYELKVSQLLKHELFPKCIDTFVYDSRMFLVWENYDNESLSFAYKNKMFNDKSEKNILQLLVKIGKGMYFAHQNQIVHGRLSGENIRLNPNLEPKVINFSLNQALDATDPGLNTIFSYQNLCAPEIKNGNAPIALSDFYSIGMIGKILLTKTGPNDVLNNISLRSSRSDLDISIAQVIDGLTSIDLTIRADNTSRFLDDSFLDPYKTPSDGIEIIKISKFKTWRLRKLTNKRKNG